MPKDCSRNPVPIPLLLHIPKCGGTTLSNCIYELSRSWPDFKAEDGYLVNGVYYYPDGFEKEATGAVPENVRRALGRDDLCAVTGHFSFGIHQFVTRPATYITLLRDPVDRVVSFYYHNRKYRDRKLYRVIHSQNISLLQFVREIGLREVDNDQTRRISGMEPPFGECTDEMLALACENLRNHFAVVGVTMLFDELLVLLQRTFAWKYIPFYRRGLVNPDRPSRAELSTETTESILEFNQLDLRLYEFAERLFREQVAAAGDEFPTQVKQFKVGNEAALEEHRKKRKAAASKDAKSKADNRSQPKASP